MSEFEHFERDYADTMPKMFAAVSDLYAKYWHDFFHFAWFEGDESWDEAFGRTHERYLAALRIDTAEQVLELACGRGGFSDLMAGRTHGQVLGIDIAEAQLRHARKYARDNLRFLRHDVMHVDELGGPFDAVAFMDAACYLPNKREAVERVAKVMRPGARLLWIDWCKQEGLAAVQEELVLHPFMRYWAIPHLETGDAYRSHFGRHFEIVSAEDLNDRTRRNWELGYDSALRAVTELSVRDLPGFLRTGLHLGSDGMRMVKEQFPAAIYIKVGFDTGFLRYKYFVLEKR